MVCVDDATSEGLSSPSWLMVWQEPACRRLKSALIKSVPLLSTSAAFAETTAAATAAAATQSIRQEADREDRTEKKLRKSHANVRWLRWMVTFSNHPSYHNRFPSASPEPTWINTLLQFFVLFVHRLYRMKTVVQKTTKNKMPSWIVATFIVKEC